MRCAILLYAGLLTLEACSTSLAPALPSHATIANASAQVVAAVRTPSLATSPALAPIVVVPQVAVAPVAAPSPIDVGALASIVTRLPHDLSRLEIDLYVCAGAIVAIGIVNAFLIASLLATRRRAAAAPHANEAARSTLQPLEPPEPPATYVEPVATFVPSETASPDARRACACGAAIGARSKTGRCRRCATASRSKRPLREVTTAPV